MTGSSVPPENGAGPRPEQRAALRTELLAGASLVHHQALQSLDIAAAVITLPEARIVAANQAAAELAGLALDAVTGRLWWELIGFEDQAAVRHSLEALSAGNVDAYRARRRLIDARGKVHEVLNWTRAVDLDGMRSAVVLLVPADERGRRLGPLVWVEPLVVGTADAQWRIVSVSSEMPTLLGGTQEDYIGLPLIALAHPDDAGGLLRAAAEAAVGEIVCRKVRLRHESGTWVPLVIALVPLTADDPPPVGFVLLPHQAEESLPAAARLSDLETRLQHIVAELRGAGFIEGIERLPSASEHPELNRLSSRQWQILIRLLAGDRVPTIAQDLFLSAGTVRNHLAAIYSLFDVHSQAELLALLRGR